MKKRKTLYVLLASFAVLVCILIACNLYLQSLFKPDYPQRVISKTTIDYSKTNLLLTNIGSGMNLQTVPLTKQQELTKKLDTPVTNDLGIPDYFLDIIVQTIPESNVKAQKAAIKLFYYKTKMATFTSQKELLDNTHKWAAAVDCVYNYLPSEVEQDKFSDASVNKWPSQTMLRLSKKIGNNLNGHVINEDFGLDKPNYTTQEACEYFISH